MDFAATFIATLLPLFSIIIPNEDLTRKSPLSVFSVRDLVYHWPITGGWDRFAGSMCRFNPCLFGFFHLLQGLLRRFTESRAGIEVRDIGDVATIFFAIKNIDMVIAHILSGCLYDTSLRLSRA